MPGNQYKTKKVEELLSKIMHDDPDRSMLCQIVAFLDLPNKDPFSKLNSFTIAKHLIKMIRGINHYKTTADVNIILTPGEAKYTIRGLQEIISNLSIKSTDPQKQFKFYLSAMTRTIRKITSAQSGEPSDGI